MLLMQIGQRGGSLGNADIKNLALPSDAFVFPETNEVFVADGYVNHRIIVFDADTGLFKRMWGAFGNEPLDNVQCPHTEDHSSRWEKKEQWGLISSTSFTRPRCPMMDMCT